MDVNAYLRRLLMLMEYSLTKIMECSKPDNKVHPSLTIRGSDGCEIKEKGTNKKRFRATDLFIEKSPGHPDSTKIAGIFADYCDDFLVTQDNECLYFYNGLYWRDGTKADLEKMFCERLEPDIMEALDIHYKNQTGILRGYISIIDTMGDGFEEDVLPSNRCLARKKNGKICQRVINKGNLCGNHIAFQLEGIGCIHILNDTSLCGNPDVDNANRCPRHPIRPIATDIEFPEELYDLLEGLGIKERDLYFVQDYRLNRRERNVDEQFRYLTIIELMKKVLVEHIVAFEEEGREAYRRFSHFFKGVEKKRIILGAIRRLSEYGLREPMRLPPAHLSVRTNGVYDFYEERIVEIGREAHIYANPTHAIPERREDIIARWWEYISMIQPDKEIGHSMLLMYSTCLIPINPGMIFVLEGGDNSGSNLLGEAVDILLGSGKTLFGSGRVLIKDNEGPCPEVANGAVENFLLPKR